MDRILIEALSVDTVIGVYDWERSIQQSLSLDLVLATDIRSAAATDDLPAHSAVCRCPSVRPGRDLCRTAR